MKKNYKTKTIEFGDLKPGDRILGSRGEPVIVDQVYEKHIPERMYEVELDNGEVIKASGNHLWYCETDKDLERKDEYLRLAREFFSKHEIPSHNEHNPHYPLAVITTKFGDEIDTRLFIEQACRSLGYSSSTPHVMVDEKGNEVGEYLIYRYSFNDLVDFLHEMKAAIYEDKGYFYFGEVRTTDEIAKLIWYNMSVNIPTEGEVK
jgi:hypothetical protein